jgi:hypothetical protein
MLDDSVDSFKYSNWSDRDKLPEIKLSNTNLLDFKVSLPDD